MDLFKSLRISKVKAIQHALTVSLVSHFFVQAFQYQIRINPIQKPQDVAINHMNIDDLSCYEKLLTPGNFYDERFYVLFGKIPEDGILDIMGLSIRNGELCDVEITQDSPRNVGIINTPSNNSPTGLTSGIRQGSRYVSDLTQSKFSRVKSFELVVDDCPFITISKTFEESPKEDAIKAMKFIFPKFSPDSQEIILRRLELFLHPDPNSLTHSGENLFSYYMLLMTFCSCYHANILRFLKSMLNSLFIEIIVHDCIGSLPVELSTIDIRISSDSFFSLNIAKSLERFSNLESVKLSGEYFDHSDIDCIQSLDVLPNCRSLTFGNRPLSDLFLDYLKMHFVHNDTTESVEKTKSDVFERLTYVKIYSGTPAFDINPDKLPCIKKMLSRQNMRIFITVYSGDSIEELSKFFSEDELNKITCKVVTLPFD